MKRIEKIVRGKATTRHYRAWLKFDKELDSALMAYQIAIVRAQHGKKSAKAYEKELEEADAVYTASHDRAHARYMKHESR